MLARTLLLPVLWSVLVLAAIVIYPLVAGLGRPVPPAGLTAQTVVPPAGQPADPRSSAMATSFGYAAAASGSSASTPDGFERAVEEEVFRLTNERRRKVGASPLAADKELAAAGRAHSHDMLKRGYFDHVTPEGLTPADRVAGIHRTLIGTAGENIYKQINPSASDPAVVAQQALDKLIASPGHRQNIEQADFTHLGVGVARDGDKVLVTQVFADAAGFLTMPLPAHVRRQGRLDLDVGHVASGEQPRQFALFRPERGVRAFGPFESSNPVVVADPGHYRLELIFATPSGRSVYFGPDIDVLP